MRPCGFLPQGTHGRRMQTRFARSPRTGLRAVIACVTAVLTACGEESTEPQPFPVVGTTRSEPAPLDVPAGEAIRLRVEKPRPPVAEAPAPLLYSAPLPTGWREVPPTQFRQWNLRVDAHPGVEAWLSVMPAGSAADNIHRWRQQMGVVAGAPEAGAVTQRPFAGGMGSYVGLYGTYTFQAGPQPNTGMLGIVSAEPGRTLSFKLVGPAEAVRELESEFLELAATVRGAPVAKEPTPPLTPPYEDSPAGAPSAAGSANDDDAGADDAGAGGPSSAAGKIEAGGYRFTMPEGWRIGGGVPFSSLTLEVGAPPPAILTVSTLAGTGGGLLMNAERWAGQLGAPAPTAADLEKLERIDVLGKPSPFLRLAGTMTQRDGSQIPEAVMLIVTVSGLDSGTTFIKFLGSRAAIEREERAFRRFCDSLEVAR